MHRVAVMLVVALADCTPLVESPATPVEAAPAPATVATRPTVEPTTAAATTGPDCLEVIDFDAQLVAMKVPAADVATARKVLLTGRTDDSKSLEEQNAAELGKALKDPMPALAASLTDYELGDLAGFAMFAIDRDRAAPLVFASMPQSDRNVQAHSFRRFLRLWFAGERICWHAVVADAARRTLEAGTNADAAEPAIYALGVTGIAADSRLLRRYLRPRESTEFWNTRLTNAAEAALARQGDRAAIDSLRRQLEAPLPKQIDFERARTLAATLNKAGYSRQRMLAPLLCRHLATPTPPARGHELAESPGERAAMALGHLLDNRPPDASPVDIDAWTKRCNTGAL